MLIFVFHCVEIFVYNRLLRMHIFAVRRWLEISICNAKCTKVCTFCLFFLEKKIFSITEFYIPTNCILFCRFCVLSKWKQLRFEWHYCFIILNVVYGFSWPWCSKAKFAIRWLCDFFLLAVYFGQNKKNYFYFCVDCSLYSRRMISFSHPMCIHYILFTHLLLARIVSRE